MYFKTKTIKSLKEAIADMPDDTTIYTGVSMSIDEGIEVFIDKESKTIIIDIPFSNTV